MSNTPSTSFSGDTDSVRRNIPQEEISRTLGLIWLDSLKRDRTGRSDFAVPNRVCALPCGCERTEGNEGGDPNEAWKVIRRQTDFVHRECGRVCKL